MDMQRGTAGCVNSHQVCLKAISFCLRTGGEHAREDRVRLLTDCAQICAVAADFMVRRSPHHPHLCRECAEACDRMDSHEEMRRCAEACRSCAESCRAMAA